MKGYFKAGIAVTIAMTMHRLEAYGLSVHGMEAIVISAPFWIGTLFSTIRYHLEK